ncbi:hypothetical protein CsatB_008431 [Cannabis sativa]|uniref:uncharacterized protein LOC115695786 n=1 Tax=Cannabis sativa TaxID=3483 RepID=UPI0029CA38F6|nr:uncharacterized protein LOC115695786 [Cannabis sativa]
MGYYTRNPNNRPNNNRPQANRRKRIPPLSDGTTSPPATKSTVEKPHHVGSFFTGQIKILKRGEELKEKVTTMTKTTTKSAVDASPPRKEHCRLTNPESPGLLGPEPLSIQTRIRSQEPTRTSLFYAGSTVCIASPPPSSLPLPVFSKKGVASTINLEATSVLLKVLRLDMA